MNYFNETELATELNEVSSKKYFTVLTETSIVIIEKQEKNDDYPENGISFSDELYKTPISYRRKIGSISSLLNGDV